MIDMDEREKHGGHTYNGGYQQKELWKQAWEHYDIRYDGHVFTSNNGGW